MLNIELAKGEVRHYWVVEVRSATSGETVTLPALENWHRAVSMLNLLADVYGKELVALYQWQVSHVYAGKHDLSE